ncbi:MAG TPA: DNA-binding protein [Coriobacteriia bacterium]|nr:DNA-binding protein [Coriobacteriia bacterium]
MPGFIDGFKQGLSEPTGPGCFQVAGVQVKCSHCGGEKFDEGSALLNTPGLTFFNLDWANRDAFLLVCDRCGKIEWFMQEPTRI